MSVYIKGMEMPKGCATCPYCDRAWNKPKCKARSLQGRFMEQRFNLDRIRQKWCPLTHVPDHGRLVDADVMERKLCYGCDACNGDTAACAEYGLIATAPTIIPADKEEGA